MIEQQRTLYQKEGEKANRARRRRRRWIGLAGLLLLALAVPAYLYRRHTQEPPSVVIRRGRVQGTVLANGEVVSEREAVLSAGVSGQVSEVRVEVGERVISGTLLLSIEAETLHRQVQQAELNLENARLRLEQALAGPRPAEVAAAQADLDLAQARLAALQGGPRAEEVALARQDVTVAWAEVERVQEAADVAVESARLAWEMAANALRDAQDAYSRIYWENERLRSRGIELSQAQKDAEAAAWRRVEDAEAAMEQARLAHEQALQERESSVTAAQARLTQANLRLEQLLAGPTEINLAEAQALVERAQAALDLLLAGPSEGERAILENEVRMAELSLQQAQSDLDKALLRAPFDGTVVEMKAREGEYVGGFTPLVRLADMNRLQVRARIDEIDVGQVAPGQAVTITLDAFPGRPLLGTVQEIAPGVTDEGGRLVYLATIPFAEPPTLTLRLGMAASLEIVTVEKENVLLLPREAVERVGAGFYVTVLRETGPERVRVVLGVSDAAHYEVLSGLREGERVLLP